MKNPTISVVIPAKNAEAHLPRTLASIEAQTLQPNDVIVVNDGSTDRTGAIARDRGATVLDTPGVGAAAALNLGIAKSTSEWIAHFDADDVMLPHKLATQADIARTTSHPIGLITSDLQMVSPSLEPIGASFLETRKHSFPFQNFVKARSLRPSPECIQLSSTEAQTAVCRQHCVDVKGLYPRRVWQEVGGFDESFACAYDMSFVWKIVLKHDIVIVPEVLFWGIRHDQNLSGSSQLVELECLRLFRSMRREVKSSLSRQWLRERIANECSDLAWAARQNGCWSEAARHWLRRWVA